MKFSAALLLLGLSGAAASDVSVLTTSNFDAHIEQFKEDGTLVEFYAPWCGHCKRLEPEYDAAAKMMKEQGIKANLAKVDATVENALATKFEVRGFPTLKWFVGGSSSEYDGPRESKGIVDWIKSVSGPAVEEVDSVPEDSDFYVAHYGDSMSDDFMSVAKANRKAAKWYFVKSSDAKVVAKHPKEDLLTMSEAVSSDSLNAFLKANSFPMFGALSGETFSKYVERGNGLMWVLLDLTDSVDETVEKNRAMYTEIAQGLGAEWSVAWTNTIEFAKVLENMFGITEFPKIVLQKKAGDKKSFTFEGPFDKASIEAYVADVVSGKIKPHLKSEPAPEEPQEDPVKVIVGSTLESMVFTESKDVMLEVYAPWCGHCKKLEPEYIKVGKKIQKEGLEDHLVVAKMDGTGNDSPVDSIEWSGFPTIFWVKAGSKEPVKYDGERTAKGMWKWIKKNASKQELIEETIKKNKEAKSSEKEEL